MPLLQLNSASFVVTVKPHKEPSTKKHDDHSPVVKKPASVPDSKKSSPASSGGGGGGKDDKDKLLTKDHHAHNKESAGKPSASPTAHALDNNVTDNGNAQPPLHRDTYKRDRDRDDAKSKSDSGSPEVKKSRLDASSAFSSTNSTQTTAKASEQRSCAKSSDTFDRLKASDECREKDDLSERSSTKESSLDSVSQEGSWDNEKARKEWLNEESSVDSSAAGAEPKRPALAAKSASAQNDVVRPNKTVRIRSSIRNHYRPRLLMKSADSLSVTANCSDDSK